MHEHELDRVEQQLQTATKRVLDWDAAVYDEVEALLAGDTDALELLDASRARVLEHAEVQQLAAALWRAFAREQNYVASHFAYEAEVSGDRDRLKAVEVAREQKLTELSEYEEEVLAAADNFKMTLTEVLKLKKSELLASWINDQRAAKNQPEVTPPFSVRRAAKRLLKSDKLPDRYR